MDNSHVALAEPRPTVWVSLALLTEPDTAKHVVEVSPAQAVAPLEVEPSLTIALKPTAPIPEPSTVTLNEPVEAWLTTPTRLTCCRSLETMPVELPIPTQLVKTQDTLRIAWSVTRECVDVSDTHAVCQHTVCPALALIERTAWPKLLPCMLTLTDPVTAKFCLDAELSWLQSADMLELAVPSLNPPVICTLLLALPPCAFRQVADVSDSHTVPSHAVESTA
jgi:hypothetical protein